MRPVAIIIAVGLLQATLAHADEFSDQIDLRPLATLEVQHLQTLKTLDSFARQTMYAIRGRSAGLDGNSALYSILDMSFRPERFDDRNIIKIRNVPLRMDLQRANISDSEKQRLLHDGLVSPRFLSADATRTLLIGLQSSSMAKADAVGQLMHASGTFDQLARPDMPLLRVIPPATDRRDDSVWHNLEEIAGNSATFTAAVKSRGSPAPPALPNFQGKSDEIDRAWNAILGLRLAWRDRDSASANRHIAELARVLPQINPQRYPSQAKRSVEVIYNRLAMLTIPGAALYLAALVCFLMSARAGVSSLRLWGLRVIALAWLVHLLGIAVRWWLVSTSVGNWFESIPIKNQFESVLMSAFFGVSVGLALELWRGRGIFGAAASFVGCLSLLAIFAAPYVFGREIGGPIGQVNGVLMSYWLYIHVTMVTASYALISMSFCLSAWWLLRCYFGNSASPARAANASRPAYELETTAGGGAAAIGVLPTLARIFFMPGARTESRAVAGSQAISAGSFLTTLDLCNLVVLQLAFWVLGAGVICGAIWADQSWGRPWGWDPKETFALVTWIVYLIVVHVRVATTDKAWWTSVLSIVGFGVMLFNWIGVNFFLVGLHSYA